MVRSNGFFEFVGQPGFDLGLPRQPIAARHAVNAGNHPLGQVQIHAGFFMVPAGGLGGVEIVQHVVTGGVAGFKILVAGLQFAHKWPLHWCAPGAH